jgi:predicted nucleotidyltransferase
MKKLSLAETAKIKGFFKKQKNIIVAYLYGSYSRGEAGLRSDLDLAVLTKYKDLFSGENTALMLGREINKKVEIANLNICSVDFAYRVVSEGKIVYVADEKRRIDFEESVLRDYFDLKPSIDEYYKYLGKIARKGDLHVRYL